MPSAPNGINVDPNGTTVTVNITTAGGSAVPVYTGRHGSNVFTMPASISAPTTFYLENPGTYIATVAGKATTVDLSGGGTFGIQVGASDGPSFLQDLATGGSGTSVSDASALTTGLLAPERIGDGSIAKAKLTTALQTTLDKADGSLSAAEAATLYAPASGSITQRFRTIRKRLVFDTLNAAEIISAASVGIAAVTRLYTPSAFRAEGRLDSAPFRYIIYTSTNHDATGGIFAHGAQSLTGPWTYLSAAGTRTYVDTVVGSSTETPQAVYFEDSRLLGVYYQQLTPDGQQTLLATTEDGLTFERLGVVFPSTNSHTGYTAITRLARRDLVATSLWFDSLASARALWRSRDGVKWTVDPRPMSTQIEQSPEPTSRRVMGTVKFFSLDGELWAIGAATVPSSGGSDNGVRTVAGPVSADLRGFAATPQIVHLPSAPSEGDSGGGTEVFVDDDGQPYLLFVGESGGVFIAKGALL